MYMYFCVSQKKEKRMTNRGKNTTDRWREFAAFMLCRQAEEIASYAHDMLVAGIITDAEMDELNKSIVLAFGLTAEDVRRQRDEIDAKIKARVQAYKALREGSLAQMGGRANG